ncbi:hypothetical protein CWIS_04450 [Cellulomonas sp. A375-1]|uniref:hypothetical protein n=1 Tax=Cellulomonas sp. A375-1 TaxID=1672219 RepID=UPI0006527EE8|nr:hypothetical protein [Cellulomonas sp. A375-1]KMM46557.1 hypothetical protein CWIS_04450 [Cellulomonas sp. A375-1]
MTTAVVDDEAAITVPVGRFDITSEDAARNLAHRLLTPGRRWPVVVVTIANGAPEPYADVRALVEDLRGLAEVVVMPTSDVSWAFSSQMPPQTQVYGGAARVYPIDHGWVTAPRAAPLRFAYSERECERVTDQLVGDAMAAAVAAGLYQPQMATSSRPLVTGTVVGVVGSRALIRLDDGAMASLWEELTGFEVPLSRLVTQGQRLRGRVDPETRRLDLEVTDEPPNHPTLPDTYVPGSAVLAEVGEVATSSLTLRLTPGLDVVAPAADVTGNDLDSLGALFTIGDVVVARLTGVAPPRLSLLDVDDDEPTLPAPSILAAGPPWLAPPEPPEVVLSDQVTAPDLTSPAVDQPHPAVWAATPPDRPAPVEPAPARRGPTPFDVLSKRAAGITPDADLAVSTPARGPASTPDLAPELAAARAQISDLKRRLDSASGAALELSGLRQHAEQLEHDLDAAERNERAYRDKYRQADRRRQKLESEAKALAARDTIEDDPLAWFTDPVDALRLSVTQAWARRIPAGEKDRWPLRPWVAGEAFADSLANLGAVSWRKLAEVVADVAVADPARLSAREHHELRQTEGGGSPAVTREDGAVCYRVALQRNTPSARRLHYWRRGDYIELSRVVLHDDTAP